MKKNIALSLGWTIALVAACTHKQPQTTTEIAPQPYAKSVVEPRSGSSVKGQLEFIQLTPTEVSIIGKVSGLKPSEKHGIHIHEKGDCSAPDGTSAGGHFNPTHANHGALDSSASHLGDLGNITADAKGNAVVSILKKGISLQNAEQTYVGHAVIIHEKVDDLKTQPTGNAGARIGCGLIEKN